MKKILFILLIISTIISAQDYNYARIYNIADSLDGRLSTTTGGWRLIPRTAGSPDVLAGYVTNDITGTSNFVMGNVIAGGGSPSKPNLIKGDSTIVATIGGGYDNILDGDSSTSDIDCSAATIAGGAHHRVYATHATIGGGSYGTVNIGSDYGVILGGTFNTIAAASPMSILGGGRYNQITGKFGVSIGGEKDTVTDDYGVIIGGYGNKVGYHGTAGGRSNSVLGDYGTSFGRNNIISGTYSFAGGLANTSTYNVATIFGSTNAVNGTAGTVVGGESNISGQYAVSGGYDNTASGMGSTSFGRQNTASGAYSLSIGLQNTASGDHSNAFGYSNTASGNYSTAIGREITVSGGYSFGIALSDQNGANLNYDNTMAVMGGKVGFGTLTPDEPFEIEFGDAAKDIEFGVGVSDPDVTFLTLRSPNGTKYYITVDDAGALSASASKP